MTIRLERDLAGWRRPGQTAPAASSPPSVVAPSVPPPSRLRASEPWRLWALLGSVAAVLIGFGVTVDARHDSKAYLARDARDLYAMAEVTGSHIDSHETGEATEYTTWVDIRFAVDGQPIRTQLHRPGRHRYPTELTLPIVYDPEHRRDADFASRINRNANMSSASLRLLVGPGMMVLGGAAAVAFGLGLLLDYFSTWRRRARLGAAGCLQRGSSRSTFQ